MSKAVDVITPQHGAWTRAHGGSDQEFSRVFEEHIRAGYQCIYIATTEEARVEAEIKRIAEVNLKCNVITWDEFEGFSGPDGLKNDKALRAPVPALEKLAEPGSIPGDVRKQQIVIFRDLDDYFGLPPVRRRLRTLCEGNRLVNKNLRRPLVIISPKLDIHVKLRAHMAVIDFRLPDEEKIAAIFDGVRASLEDKYHDRIAVTPELREQVIRCLMGLTGNEAENCLSRCLVKHGGYSPDMLATIKAEKASIIKKSEVLTYIPESNAVDRGAIGGFDAFLTWLDRRKLAYTRKARDLGIDYPKGVILLGPPGTGKSLVAKAACRLMGLPGYILDIGTVFSSLVGSSEERMRDAIKQVEAQQGCVLLIDEADKAFGNATESTGDSGVTQRVFGTFLTWLAENKSPTFVIMTLNRTKRLPPELLRAGRFDAIFFTDLPTTYERQEILQIHLRIRGIDPALLVGADGRLLNKDDWKALIDQTNEYVGSELEEVVKESRYLALAQRETGTPVFEELCEAAAGVIPMARHDAATVAEIREFCRTKGKPVSIRTGGKGKGRAARDVDLSS